MKESEFNELLLKLSTTIGKKGEKHVDMLRVLYTDLANSKTELQEAESAFDLFKLLIGPGILKATDISVLFETIELTGFRYLKEIIQKYETCPVDVKISRFSAHRQHVVALGRGFSVKEVQKISQLYRGNTVFPNQWKLIIDLETDVLTEDKMSTFLQCLKENGVNKDFNKLLLELSEAIGKKDERYIDLLRVLYTDLAIAKTDLEEAKSAFDLFQILIVAGALKQTDISVLFETIELTRLRYLKEIIEKYEAYPFEVMITHFSPHRQQLVALGRNLSVKHLQTVRQICEVPVKISTNPWKVITFLENEGIISEGNLSSLLLIFRTVGSGEPSTSKRPMIEKGRGLVLASKRQKLKQDVIIKDFLTMRQKQLYENVNRMTPTIWHKYHEVDIAEVFTELILMQSKKEDKGSRAKSTSIKRKVRSASLTEVLDVIKSTDSCKVLITGKGGMGKTTLLRYIAYQWATDGKHNAFANELLFLINIRDIKAGETFLDIIMKKIDLKSLIFENDLAPNSVEAFLATHADEIVILLDGYDEIERDAKDPIHLFERTELGKSTVLMSSRPDNVVKFVKCCDIHIKVKGFSPNNIKEYIRKHFHSIGKAAIGNSLIREFTFFYLVNSNDGGDGNDSDDDDDDDDEVGGNDDNSNDDDNYDNGDVVDDDDDNYYYDNGDVDDDIYDDYIEIGDIGCDHKEAFELCSSPLLLLSICTIWEYKQCLPTDLSDLFKELFCSILNQYQNRSGDKTSISQFERIPEEYRHAILLLGECMYEGLKENKLSIDKYVLSKKAMDEKMVCLALNLGFVYEESPIQPGDVREIYTTPHKLISEALAGLYLSEQSQKEVLNTDEYEVIRSNKYLHMTRVFTMGFLGADACKLLKYWLIIRASNYYSIAQCFRHVKKEYEVHVLQELDKHMSNEMKAHCEQMCESAKSVLNDKDVTNVHVMKIVYMYDNLQYIDVQNAFPLINTYDEESLKKSCRNIVHNTVVLPRVYQTESFLKYISVWEEKEINILADEMKNLDLTYNLTSVSLSFKFKSSFFIHFLKHASDLSILHIYPWLTSSLFNVVINELHKNKVMLKLTKLDISNNDLSSVSGRALAYLFQISPQLMDVDMNHCCLSGSIINEMIEECGRTNVVLKNNMFRLIGNNLSDINAKSLAELVRVSHLTSWTDYSLTADNLEKLVESIGVIGSLNWKRIDMSQIDLSSVSGRTLARLLKISTHLIHIDMRHCSLSGSIINEMMENCHKMNVILKGNMFRFDGNALSDINGKSLVEIIRVYNRPNGMFKWRDYSFTANNLEELVGSIGKNETLKWKSIDMSRINLSAISGRTLACLFKISTQLAYIDMRHCSLSGSIINEMMEECCRINVAYEGYVLRLEGNDLSGVNANSLVELPVVKVLKPHNTIEWRDYFLAAELGRGVYKHLYYTYTSWSDYSFTADNLEKLVESIGENAALNWNILDVSGVNLSSMSGRTLACLFKISPHLVHINMRNCSLSGSIINEMREECHKMNVVLKYNMFILEGNDLSDINGKSLVELIIQCYDTFTWKDYSLTTENLEKLIEAIGDNETLNWKMIDMSKINLSSVCGKTLACLFKISPQLIRIEMRHCGLSGSIVNEMMEECLRMNVVLKDNMLSLLGNNLSDINGKSLAELLMVIYHPYGTFRLHDEPFGYISSWSHYSLSANNLEKMVKSVGENETLKWKSVTLRAVNLASVSGTTLAYLFKISIHLIYIDMSFCSLSGSIFNEMMEECGRINVILKKNMIALKGNDLSGINGKSLAELITVILHHRFGTFVSYLPHLSLNFRSSWSDYSLTANNLEKMVKSVGEENGTLNWRSVCFKGTNLSSITGRTLACLLKVSTDMRHIDLSHCNLAGSIVNEMMEECFRMNVVLKDKMLTLEGNDLSDINGKSLVKLIKVYNRPHGMFKWRDYSFAADNLEKLVESIGENETLNWKEIDMSRIDLSSVSGRTLAYLFKVSTDISHVVLSQSNLSGSIINKMMEDCSRMNVVLKDNMLTLKGNDLSDINGKSLVELIRVLKRPHDMFKWRDYSFTANNLEMLVKALGRIETLNWKIIDMSRINLSSISGGTLAYLLKVSKDIIHIDLAHCNLSGSIVNEMIEECHRMNVVLKDNMLTLEGNDLSDVNGKSLVELVRVLYRPSGIFKWRDYSFTADNLVKLVESIDENETLNWKRIDMSKINLSSVSGRTLACLFKISKCLVHIDMKHCNVSASIFNEMMVECGRRDVILKDKMLSLEGNDFSIIGGGESLLSW